MKGNRVRLRSGSNKRYSGLEVSVPTEVVKKCSLQKGVMVDVIPLEEGMFLVARIDKNVEEVYWGSEEEEATRRR